MNEMADEKEPIHSARVRTDGNVEPDLIKSSREKDAWRVCGAELHEPEEQRMLFAGGVGCTD